jgi:hypothetical protein
MEEEGDIVVGNTATIARLASLRGAFFNVSGEEVEGSGEERCFPLHTLG